MTHKSDPDPRHPPIRQPVFFVFTSLVLPHPRVFVGRGKHQKEGSSAVPSGMGVNEALAVVQKMGSAGLRDCYVGIQFQGIPLPDTDFFMCCFSFAGGGGVWGGGGHLSLHFFLRGGGGSWTTRHRQPFIFVDFSAGGGGGMGWGGVDLGLVHSVHVCLQFWFKCTFPRLALCWLVPSFLLPPNPGSFFCCVPGLSL